MQFEQTYKALPVDDKINEAVQGYLKEGWQLIPGVVPVAVFHFIRPVVGDAPKTSEAGGQLNLHVDEAKIFMHRANGDIEDNTGKVIGRWKE